MSSRNANSLTNVEEDKDDHKVQVECCLSLHWDSCHRETKRCSCYRKPVLNSAWKGQHSAKGKLKMLNVHFCVTVKTKQANVKHSCSVNNEHRI